MTAGALGEERPTLFLRKATGLVRGWSVRDSLIYACLATNFVTLGIYEFTFAGPAFPKGQLITATIIGGNLGFLPGGRLHRSRRHDPAGRRRRLADQDPDQRHRLRDGRDRLGTICPIAIRPTKPVIDVFSSGSAPGCSRACCRNWPRTYAIAAKLDLSEAFIDASFSSAKKGALVSALQNAGKAAKSWQLQTAMVFLSPCTWPALDQMKRSSSKPPSSKDFSEKLPSD